ncbi:restriction endonuclease subunit S [Nonlabens arenilitoris]
MWRCKIFKSKKITNLFYSKMNRGRLADLDVLINKDGANTGKVGLYRDAFYKKASINEHLFLLRGCEELIDNIYLYYDLLSETGQLQIKRQITGSAQPGLNSNFINYYYINLPPLPQQKKIAQILSTVDEVIEQTESAIAKYQAIKQGLMHDLFTRGIDINTGKLRPSPQDAPQLYKESALGLIPREWEVQELGKENETYAGGTPNRSIDDYYKGEIPWVASGEVNQSFIFKTKESISSDALRFSSAKMAPKESVLIAMYGATAAQVSMLKIDACTNQAVLAIIPNSLWNNYFIYYGLNYSKDRILFLAQGSGQPNLNKKMIDTTQFWKPTLAEQKLVVERLGGIESKIQTEQQALGKYQQLKAGLMQDLLTGRVGVVVD